MTKTFTAILKWAIVLAMPFFLGFTTIRLVIAPWYPAYEYAKESFPPDQYGFTQAERLELALVAVDYLRRSEPSEEVIYLLEEQTLPGSDEPLYLESEIGHMIDVKNVTDVIHTWRWITTVVVVGGLAVLLARSATRREGYRALMQGGITTTIILVGIAGFILIGWDTFFVEFHELLFPPGTWTFRFSDSLIRLFPVKFWFDVGVIMSVGTLLEGIAAAVIGYWLLRHHVIEEVTA